MSEGLEREKLSVILDVSVLFVGTPTDEVIVLKHKRFWAIALLHQQNRTYLRKDDTFCLALSAACSL